MVVRAQDARVPLSLPTAQYPSLENPTTEHFPPQSAFQLQFQSLVPTGKRWHPAARNKAGLILLDFPIQP